MTIIMKWIYIIWRRRIEVYDHDHNDDQTIMMSLTANDLENVLDNDNDNDQVNDHDDDHDFDNDHD